MEEKKIWAIKDGYLVNRDGSIYKLNWRNTGTMRKVKQTKMEIGYLCFNLNGKIILSHRFVAECFIPNTQNLPEINHKDEDKTNNKVENLEWCDGKYNSNWGTGKIRQGKSKINHPKLSKRVLQYTLYGEFVKEWESTMEIFRQLGYKHNRISDACLGKLKTYKGCVWKYAN